MKQNKIVRVNYAPFQSNAGYGLGVAPLVIKAEVIF